MKRTFSIALSLLVTFAVSVAQANEPADEILGQWYTEDDASKVHVIKQDGKYFGRIIWLDEPLYEKGDPEAGKVKHDRKNRDKSLQARPIMGMQVLKDFKYDSGDSEWNGGTIYDPDVGKVYKCEIKFQTDPKAEGGKHLHLRGYIGIPALGRTTVWLRVPKEEMEKTD